VSSAKVAKKLVKNLMFFAPQIWYDYRYIIFTCAGEKMRVVILIVLAISVGSTAALPFSSKY